MPSTTAIKGCYSSCAWRSDPLSPPRDKGKKFKPPPPTFQVIKKDNQQRVTPTPDWVNPYHESGNTISYCCPIHVYMQNVNKYLQNTNKKATKSAYLKAK